MASASQHFARMLVGQTCAIDTAMGGGATSTSGANLATRSMHTSSSARAVGVPTLGETGMKFNSSRWTQADADTGLSVFDMRGAMETLQKVGITLYGFKVFPDLTPGKAFMWGSIVAVYVVGLASFSIARSVGISSMDDIKQKMQLAFAPYKEALQAKATAAKSAIELKEQPALMQQLKIIGRSISHTLGKPEALLEDDDLNAQ